MKPISLGFLLITMVAFSYQEPIESLNHILVYPMEPGTKKSKREATDVKNKLNEFTAFVEEKLIQHTQALEHLVKLAQTNENTIQELVTTLSSKFEKPKVPEKIEVQHETRRSNIKTETPIVRFGRNVPKYGMFFKDILLAELSNDEEPVAVAERVISNSKSESRRSFGGSPMVFSNAKNEKPSPWCSVAVLCRRSFNPICGYDDNFGYAKFDDICHMLQVNCYWKYNFALVPSCNPVL